MSATAQRWQIIHALAKSLQALVEAAKNMDARHDRVDPKTLSQLHGNVEQDLKRLGAEIGRHINDVTAEILHDHLLAAQRAGIHEVIHRK